MLGLQESEARKVFFAPDFSQARVSPATKQLSKDLTRFSKEIGFRPITPRKTLRRPNEYYAKLVGAWVGSEVFLSSYPAIANPIQQGNRARDLDAYLLNFLHALRKKTRSILYIWDLPIEQNIAVGNPIDNRAYALEKKILSSFDILCVFNRNMRETIMQRYGIEGDRFVEFEILDYGVDFTATARKNLTNRSWRIVYAGNCDSRYLGFWFKSLPYSSVINYEFLGPDCDWVSHRNDVIHTGLLSNEELARYISTKGHFGIVLYSDSFREYVSKYTSTSKFAAYVTAGLPVLVRAEYNYLSRLVREYGVGLIFNTFEELPALIENLPWTEYMAIRNRCLELGLKLRRGHFFKSAMSRALRKLQVNQVAEQ
jgi:hypothetical protein